MLKRLYGKEVVPQVVTNQLAEMTFSAPLCVPKTLSELMTLWIHLSWRNDRATPLRSGRLGLAIQVEVAA
jgi:hypothetical protein